MKILCMKIAVWILKNVYRLFWPLKVKRKVVMLSRQSSTPSLDYQYLEKELNRRGIKNVILCHELKGSLSGLLQYMFHILQQMRHIADASVIVTDGYCMLLSLIEKKEEQTVVQIWHSLAAIKKFGWQNVDAADGRGAKVAKVMKMHRNYDYFLAPSDVTANHFAESFGTDRDKAVLLGLPRIDYIKHPSPKIRKAILETYPILLEKRNIIYAPTFRKGKELELGSLLRYFPFDRYNLIVKKHPLDQADYSRYEREGLLFDQKFDTMDWYPLCTKVITDYSGVAIEAAVAQRELYFYLPDRTNYSASQGLNMNFEKESIRNYVCQDGRSFCDLLRAPYNKNALLKFLKKYVSVSTEHCTEDMVDFIETLL